MLCTGSRYLSTTESIIFEIKPDEEEGLMYHACTRTVDVPGRALDDEKSTRVLVRSILIDVEKAYEWFNRA